MIYSQTIYANKNKNFLNFNEMNSNNNNNNLYSSESTDYYNDYYPLNSNRKSSTNEYSNLKAYSVENSKNNKLKFYRKESKSYQELKKLNTLRRFELDSKGDNNKKTEDLINNRASLKFLNVNAQNFGKEKLKSVINRLQATGNNSNILIENNKKNFEDEKFLDNLFDLERKKKRVKNFSHIYKRDNINIVPGKVNEITDRFIEKNEKKKQKKILEEENKLRINKQNSLKVSEINEQNDEIDKLNMKVLIERMDSDETLMEMENQLDEKVNNKQENLFEKEMARHVDMDRKELEFERLYVKKHFVGNVVERINEFKVKNKL